MLTDEMLTDETLTDEILTDAMLTDGMLTDGMLTDERLLEECLLFTQSGCLRGRTETLVRPREEAFQQGVSWIKSLRLTAAVQQSLLQSAANRGRRAPAQVCQPGQPPGGTSSPSGPLAGQIRSDWRMDARAAGHR